MEGTPLFSFWGADSFYLSGSWWHKFLLVWRFQGPELFWSTEHQFPPPPTPILDRPGGPSPGEGCKAVPSPGRAVCQIGGQRAGVGLMVGGALGGGAFSLVLKHLRSCSQGFFWAVLVRGPGRGGLGEV